MKLGTLIVTGKELTRLAKIFENVKDDEKILLIIEQKNFADWHLRKNQL